VNAPLEGEVFDWLCALAEARAAITATLAAAGRADALSEELLSEDEQDSLREAREVLVRLDTRLRSAVLSGDAA
jgi:hypothetical protein